MRRVLQGSGGWLSSALSSYVRLRTSEWNYCSICLGLLAADGQSGRVVRRHYYGLLNLSDSGALTICSTSRDWPSRPIIVMAGVKPGFHSNAIACVGKQPIMHLPLLRPNIPVGWRKRLLRENFTQQTQAPANRNVRSKQWQPWLAAYQRKRLRLNGNRALETERHNSMYPETIQALSINVMEGYTKKALK